MTRGPFSKKSFEAALPAAEGRGLVTVCKRGRDSICDLVIHAHGATIAVMLRMSRRLHCPLAEMESRFAEPLGLFRLIPDDPCRSRELWVCNPYSTLRFFRVEQNGLTELDHTGQVLKTTGMKT